MSSGGPLPAATWATTDTLTYAYDSAGQLSALSDFEGNTTTIADSPLGQPVAMTLGNTGDSVYTAYDDQANPASIALAGSAGSTLLGFSYARAPAGTIATETDTPATSSTPASYVMTQGAG